jgi:hypothetical protein
MRAPAEICHERGARRWNGFTPKRWQDRREILAVLTLGCILIFSSPVKTLADTVLAVNVNTTALAGTQVDIAFDFIDGGPPASDNTVILSNFLTDGTLGAVSPSGGASGTLPETVTLTDPSFFNEYLTAITLGNGFSFQLDATTNGPGLGSLPDAFSIAILDPTTGLPLFTTTDPTGADSMLLFNIDGSADGSLSVYSAPNGEGQVTATPVSPIPEPGTLVLLGAGLSGALFLCRKAKSLSVAD